MISRHRIKFIMAVAVLILPIVVILFLHFFGENEYRIPVYDQEALLKTTEISPDSAALVINHLNKIPTQLTCCPEGVRVVVFPGMVTSSQEKGFSATVFKVLNVFDTVNFKLVAISDSAVVDSNFLSMNLDKHKVDNTIITLPLSTIDGQVRFTLGSVSRNAVLFDDKQALRGLYNLSSYDEVNRLIAELKVLTE